MKPPTVFLGEMTNPEVEAFLKQHHTVIIPTGATEQHGPHGPLLTDVYIPQEVARRVAPAIGAVVLGYVLGWLDRGPALGLGVGGFAVAVVGWIDDRVGLSAGLRLVAQVAAASWLVAWLGGYPTLDLGVARLPMSPLDSMVVVLAIVWSTNLYNFMDGIDGIAGVEAVCVASVGGALLLLSGANGLGVVALVIAAASAGFLVWNRPPARIFMGDAGSGLLGFMLAGLAFAGEKEGVPALIWVILLGAFVADATIVVVRRMTRGERWYSAHRTHLYQRLVQSGWTHGRVDLALLGINGMLSVLGASAWRWREFLPAALAIAVVLVGVAYALGERRMAKTANPSFPPSDR